MTYSIEEIKSWCNAGNAISPYVVLEILESYRTLEREIFKLKQELKLEIFRGDEYSDILKRRNDAIRKSMKESLE